jgi:hypothetical protein
LLLVGKLGLEARIYHYGFALAMPGVLLVAVALVAWVPSWLERRGRAGQAFGALCAALLLALSGVQLERMFEVNRELVASLGADRDLIRAEPTRTQILESARVEIERLVPPSGSLLVLPEGVVLNYLTRRSTPSRYYSFTPFDLILWGEDAVVESIRRAPPAAVLVVHRRTAEYGALFLGSDYGLSLMKFVEDNYRPAQQWGGTPLQPGTVFGATLWLPLTAAR